MIGAAPDRRSSQAIPGVSEGIHGTATGLLMGSTILVAGVLAVYLVRSVGGLQALSQPQVLLLALAAVVVLGLLAGLVALFARRGIVSQVWKSWRSLGRAPRQGVRLMAGALPIVMAAAFLGNQDFQTGYARGLVFCCALVFEWLALAAAMPQLNGFGAAALAVVVLPATWKAAAFASSLSASPLSLGWSEASRYYYASLFLSQRVYGLETDWPVLHPSRYLLQAVPFLWDDTPIWVHRAWQAALWIGMAGALSAALAWRWIRSFSLRFWLLAGWAFLFLFQGPVYYHFALGVLPILLGFRADRPWRNLALVCVGSVWAGLSRINWYPVPGLVAAALFALESSAAARPHWSWRDWRWPAAWIILGSLTSGVVGILYAWLSGNDLSQFGSSFASDLLWYRLLPNATYPLGVLPAVAIVVLPTTLVLWMFRQDDALRDPYRLVLLGGIAAVLFVGGVVVSVKIGGGGDLHNMDAFLVLLLLICGTIMARRSFLRAENADPDVRQLLVVGLVLLVPAAFSVTSGQVLQAHDRIREEAALADVRVHVENAASEGTTVLFLTQRQLLTFDEIAAPLIEPYEKVHLMEMAMSRNQDYLARFRQDLEQHRFGMIVSDSLNTNRQGATHAFGEENDAWLDGVIVPLLDSYRVVAQLADPDILLLVPIDD